MGERRAAAPSYGKMVEDWWNKSWIKQGIDSMAANIDTYNKDEAEFWRWLKGAGITDDDIARNGCSASQCLLRAAIILKSARDG